MASASPMPVQPNILLIVADELRADALSVYGNPVCRTPSLDRMAAAGVAVRRLRGDPADLYAEPGVDTDRGVSVGAEDAHGGLPYA